MSARVASCVWRVSPELLVAIDERLGEPTDAYVNGSQVWLRDDGPQGVTVEWRLHPAPGFVRPKGVGTHELLEWAVFALHAGEALPAPLESLWEGLEAFPAFGDDVEPAPLAAACTAVLGRDPDAYGMVDHRPIGDRWEETEGRISIVEGLLRQLSRPAES